VPATVSTTTGPLGTYLTSVNGRTLYLFGKDTGTTSTCVGTCTENWPPLLTKGAPKAAGQAQPAKLGTTARSEGTTQVTYAGQPLYLFIGDTAPGQTKGQGVNAFGGVWYVVSPAGNAIQTAPAATSAPATSSGGAGY
jgi:predicted lipoprotein with Yx(FWY)xxD motif